MGETDGKASLTCLLAIAEAEASKLEEENAKLRELVKDFFDVPCQCLKCAHYNYEEDRCDLRDRACELGVEVDKLVSENERLREVVTA